MCKTLEPVSLFAVHISLSLLTVMHQNVYESVTTGTGQCKGLTFDIRILSEVVEYKNIFHPSLLIKEVDY